MLCVNEEDGTIIMEGTSHLIPLDWPSLHIVKTEDDIMPSINCCLSEVSLPYLCEALWAPIFGLGFQGEIDCDMTVSEEGITNIIELMLSGWTVELDVSNGVNRATCTWETPDVTYRFYVEGEIELIDTVDIGKALFGNMRVTGSDFIRDLHKKNLLSATKSTCITSKIHNSRGRETQQISIGGPSPTPTPTPTPRKNALVLGQCSNIPVVVKLSSFLPLNPQAATYLQYSPVKPGRWNKLFIPSLGIKINSRDNVIISQGLIVVLDAKVLLSSEWECLQTPELVVPGIYKRTISKCEHLLQIHGSFLRYEPGNTLLDGHAVHLRSKSFSNLEIVEGENKSRFAPENLQDN